MITRGCCVFTLLVSYVLSNPVPSDQVAKDDIKVMKCIVEVIADTLSKPHPIAVSQECQDSLTGDDRIASILRHQNLLKELQEIAAEGVSERVHQPPQKKNEDDSDHVTDGLGGHPGVEDTTGEQWEPSTAKEGAADRGDPAEGDNEVEEESREKSGESREGNEIGGTNEGEAAGEAEEGEEKETDGESSRNCISDSVNRGQEEEEQEEDEEKTAPAEEEETHSSSGEDEGKGKQGNETEEDDSTQVSKDGETEQPKSVPDAESDAKRSEEGEAEEEEEMEGEPGHKRPFEGAEKEGEEDATSEVKDDRESEPGFERSSERGEESPRQPSGAAEEDGRAGGEGRNPMEETQGSPQLLWYAPHRSEENSPEEAQELHVEEKREEEGSGSHRGEDHEIERLAAIESELESVAQRLHELRRG
ncbi:chromogranin-A-like isoform X1 [Anguilla rostrata]|uniref:chromogranin-A-like isoform X1 n=1 Tax=Anguilla rostrata TaxID=7938 RepID=UPI0030D25FA5